MKWNWSLIALLVVWGCVSNKNQSSYHIEYASFECMGKCPVYTVKIDSLRNLTFQGSENVRKGTWTYKISKKEYSGLVKELDELMKEMPKDVISIHPLDSGGKELVVWVNGEEKVFSMENGKPRTAKLDSILNSILYVRGLMD